ncbi:hypothetical protein BX666DRAFT_1904302 [Dichotomocladium elegans]|nr:hypothetical protein BX666DRAFT_1904302 [Dichotomocladium elegans]
MRTSRGLQITSIIVAFPVLLILSSLVLILALSIQTQLKAWAIQHQPAILMSRPISRLASTALAVSPKPITRRLLLKRFLPSTVWSWLGVLTVFAFITVQKLDLVSCSQKAYAFITPPLTKPSMVDCGSSKNFEASVRHAPPAGTPVEDAVASTLKTTRRKKIRTKPRSSNISAAQKITFQSFNISPPSTLKQGHRRREQQKHKPQQEPLLDYADAQSTAIVALREDSIVCCDGGSGGGSSGSSSSSSSSSEEEETSEWISVGEKKKKRERGYPHYCQAPQQQDNELSKAPVVQEEVHQPVIRNWYSPFSTGLDLDIMPPRTKQDGLQNWRMDPFYQHAPFFQEQPFSFFDHAMSV